MNEELQKALVDILNGVLSAKDFVLSELPDVIAQLLLWKMWYHGAQFASFVVLISIALYLSHKWFKPALAISTYADPWLLVHLLLTAIGVGVPFMWFNLTWLQIWLAPKVYLIEYAASLTK